MSEERGIPGLRCFLCGEEDSLSVRVCDGVVVCSANECEINTDMLSEHIGGMQTLLAFVKHLPVIEEHP
jgi:hypothetical protein